ncbi:DUF2063 domain-containing protein [Nitrogeniibacter mangrovi]|uniref:DUF2063 domain-containing protein n=1 Tax=Nitrogeniibacter mangrovi TaxID=2016596 RepID=A0A6C1B4M3_9RHOO|nr:DNA-binding domain-containing protein [Nitrogeniibacter mangrovi]QID18656.1 DUF2063 domain-containing protein [Nitrogeniibacter mangrovi]
MSLVTLQQQMQAAVTAGGVPPGLSGNARGLEVYRTAWRVRLIEALRTNYPALHRVLGDAAFAELATRYLRAHPSQRRSIRWFGHRLPEFIAAHSDTLPHPALRDLARMEWAVCLAFDAADFVPLAFAQLAATPPDAWPTLVFTLQPAVALLELQWSVAPVWRELSTAEDPDRQVAPPERLDNTILVWRKALSPNWRSIAPLEADLLRAVAAGECFGQLCERAVASAGEVDAAATVGAYLQQWVADELLVGA